MMRLPNQTLLIDVGTCCDRCYSLVPITVDISVAGTLRRRAGEGSVSGFLAPTDSGSAQRQTSRSIVAYVLKLGVRECLHQAENGRKLMGFRCGNGWAPELLKLQLCAELLSQGFAVKASRQILQAERE
jgi:hypothetical protein